MTNLSYIYSKLCKLHCSGIPYHLHALLKLLMSWISEFGLITLYKIQSDDGMVDQLVWQPKALRVATPAGPPFNHQSVIKLIDA